MDDDLLLAAGVAVVGFLMANPLVAGSLALAVGAPEAAGNVSRKYEDVTGVPGWVADLVGWSSLVMPLPGPVGTIKILDWLKGFK
jgi:hypothetical protein